MFFISKSNSKYIIKIIKDNYNIISSVTILKEEKNYGNFSKVSNIEDVVVDIKYRGKDIGSMLINIAKDECKDCYKIILNCSEDKFKFSDVYIQKLNLFL